MNTYVVTRNFPSHELNWGIDFLNWLQSRPKHPEPTWALTKLLQQMLVSGQISPTDVDLRSIVSLCRQSSLSIAVVGPNKSNPEPNIFNRRRGSHNIRQVTSALLLRIRGYSRLSPTDVAVPRFFSNRWRDSMNYFQSRPGLSKPALWSLWSRLKYWLPVFLRHTRWRLSPFLWLIDSLSTFCGFVACVSLLMLK